MLIYHILMYTIFLLPALYLFSHFVRKKRGNPDNDSIKIKKNKIKMFTRWQYQYGMLPVEGGGGYHAKMCMLIREGYQENKMSEKMSFKMGVLLKRGVEGRVSIVHIHCMGQNYIKVKI